MANTKSTFRQSDIERAIKGAKACGVNIYRIKIGADGAIEIFNGPPSDEGHLTPYEKWKAEQNASASKGH